MPTVALPISSPVAFAGKSLGRLHPIASDSSHPIFANVRSNESEGSTKESECLIEKHVSSTQEQVKREEASEGICLGSPTNSFPSDDVNLISNQDNHFLALFSQGVQKF
ncbi:hypothetical protein M9H77_23501 [Catharanthus roseus]|uniref:Uncharacterized protein n=1 Tax=Catharanthus roseus TaxID=4058 RepID=A0ACC0AXL8_CATRO|nr:hypothetical protein M9H77_23501 [Catharanthus roseus]